MRKIYPESILIFFGTYIGSYLDSFLFESVWIVYRTLYRFCVGSWGGGPDSDQINPGKPPEGLFTTMQRERRVGLWALGGVAKSGLSRVGETTLLGVLHHVVEGGGFSALVGGFPH